MTKARPSETPRTDLPIIEAADLARAFGSRRAVAGVTFTLLPGDCLAVFGPNGAGKTTLLRLLAGLLKPTSGGALLAGIALPGGPLTRSRVGLISHHTMLYGALSARENVSFAARLYGIRDPGTRVEDSLRRLSMLERADAPVRLLSRGMQQRVSAVTFALLGLVIFYYSWDPTAVAVTDLAPGVLWIVFTFSGLLGLHRSFGVESADHAIDRLLASPVSREAIFLGKAIANLVFVAAV